MFKASSVLPGLLCLFSLLCNSAHAEANAAGQVSYGWNPQRSNSDSPLYARIPDTANVGASQHPISLVFSKTWYFSFLS